MLIFNHSAKGYVLRGQGHLDALWETASTIAGPLYPVNPAEGYVFGAAILLHDAGMALASYPNGISEVYSTTEWRDSVTTHLRDLGENRLVGDEINNPPESIVRAVLPKVLRSLHAKRAEQLPTVSWQRPGTGTEYLIEDTDLREFYGSVIGRIAASHHWPVSRLPQVLQHSVGAFPKAPSSWGIDPLKLACLLRAADAAHIDERRAPRFLRMLLWPGGISATHWNFQSKLAKPRLDGDALLFTSGPDFALDDADAWWLCFDTVSMIDEELRNCDLLLEDLKLPRFAAKRVRASGSPQALSTFIRTSGWEPVDTIVKVSDVPRLIRMLGGSHLYGDDNSIPIRELIQNGADAINARRLMEKRDHAYGEVRLCVEQRGTEYWLVVEDDGVGMSLRTLTGALLDFGKSFWSSEGVQVEFPGLVSLGMQAIGRYGIGFFSVFMLGDVVIVSSRRFDAAQEKTYTLEFRSGLELRPILRLATQSEQLRDGGTRVSVLMRKSPYADGGLLLEKSLHPARKKRLEHIVVSMCPTIDVNVRVTSGAESVLCISAGDWLAIRGDQLLRRVSAGNLSKSSASNLRVLQDKKGIVHGRACILSEHQFSWLGQSGVVTVGGFAAMTLNGIAGVLLGDSQTVARNMALPTVPAEVLANWASEQALLLAKSELSNEQKLRSAGYIMQCGGDISDLPVIRRGSGYLNTGALRKLLSTVETITTYGGDSVDYDEDRDGCHPREFRDYFEPDEDLVFVGSTDLQIATINGKAWPASILDPASLKSFQRVLRQAMEDAWGGVEEWSQDDFIVGFVSGDEIKRSVTIFTQPGVEPG